MDLFDGDTPEIEPVDSHTRGIGLSVYKETWDEFYRWEQDECRRALDSLAISELSSPPFNPQSIHDLDYTGSSFDFDFEAFNSDSNLDTETFTREEFDVHENSVRYSTLTCFTQKAMQMKGYPRYEMCTPASRNYARDPFYEQNQAPFVPYADDMNFKFEEHLDPFDEFSWQVDFIDPDLELIDLETARRLHFTYDLTLEEITHLQILHRPLRVTNASGLLWETAQRDIPWWTGLSSSETPSLPTSFVPPDASIEVFGAIDQAMRDFCPNLNCLSTFCPTHRYATAPYKYPGLDVVKPTLTSASLRLRVSDGDSDSQSDSDSKGEPKPCGEYCFRLYEDDVYMESVYWEDKDDTERLESILKFIPDESPCDLAIICRKKCREVFTYRCRLLPDDKIQAEIFHDVELPFIPPRFVDKPKEMYDPPVFAPVTPCHHKGRCDQNSSCPCYDNGQHCQRSCRCDFKSCKIRWKGCKCKPPKQSSKSRSRAKATARACESEYCPCRLTGRECDPDLCVTCDASFRSFNKTYRDDIIGARNKNICGNVDIQRGNFQPTIIKRGKFGLGAFAGCAITKDTLVGEYVAETMPSDCYNANPIHDYTGLNYMFQLNATFTMDAAKLGNEMRFMNDARVTNCQARVVMVNGDHRIVLLTTKDVRRGEELILDYGEQYWRDNSKRE